MELIIHFLFLYFVKRNKRFVHCMRFYLFPSPLLMFYRGSSSAFQTDRVPYTSQIYFTLFRWQHNNFVRSIFSISEELTVYKILFDSKRLRLCRIVDIRIWIENRNCLILRNWTVGLTPEDWLTNYSNPSSSKSINFFPTSPKKSWVLILRCVDFIFNPQSSNTSTNLLVLPTAPSKGFVPKALKRLGSIRTELIVHTSHQPLDLWTTQMVVL